MSFPKSTTATMVLISQSYDCKLVWRQASIVFTFTVAFMRQIQPLNGTAMSTFMQDLKQVFLVSLQAMKRHHYFIATTSYFHMPGGSLLLLK